MVTPGSRLVALRRTTADAGSVVAVLLTVLVVTVLVTGVVAVLPALQEQALRRAMEQLPADQAVVTVVAAHDADSADEEDRAVRAALQPLLDVAGGVVVRQVRTVAHPEAGAERSWSFLSADGAAGPAVVAVAGRLPDPGARPLEVAVPAGQGPGAGQEPGAGGRPGGPESPAPGTRLTVTSPFDDTPVPVVVTGTWEPAAGAERALEGVDPQTLLVHPDDLATVAGRASSVRWVAAPEADAMPPRDLGPLIAAARSTDVAVEAAAEQVGTGMRVENPLVATFEDRGRELLAQRMLLLVPAVLLLLLGATAAMLVASALHQDRRDDEWLMRSRGAGRGQLVAPTMLEALTVAAVGAVAGPLLATAVVRIGGVRPTLDATVWVAGAVAAAVVWVALVVPAVVSALTGDRGEQLSVEKRRRRSLTALIAVGLLMVALGGVAVTRLGGFADTVAAGWSAAVDPLLVAAPSMLVLALAGVLVLGLVPLLFRLTERAVRSRGLVLAVGTRTAARAPAKAVPLALAVALLAGGVVFASVERVSQEAAREARASYDVGSDVRVTPPPASLRGTVPEEREALRALPGVVDVSAVNRQLEFVDDVAAEVLVADLAGPVGEGLLAFADDLQDIRERLGVRTDGAVPVAVTPDLVEQASLEVGRSLEVALGAGTTTLTVTAVVPALPTVADGRAGMLVDRTVLGAQGPPVPDEWWLASSDPHAAAEALERTPAVAGQVLTRERALDRLADDPGTGGEALADVMAVTALGSVLLGTVLLASVVVLRRRERDAQTAALHALGAAERDVTMVVATEYTLVTGGGILAGAVAGVVTAAVALRATALGAGGRPLTPAPELVVPWGTTLALLAVLLVVPALTLLTAGRRARRTAGGGHR